MAEKSTQPQQVTSTAKKAIAGLSARLENAVGEVGKLRSKGLAQANLVLETATRATQEQVAFAEQMGSEWRKLMLAAARSATALFTPKS